MFQGVHIVFIKKLKYSLLTNNISGNRSQTEERSNFLFINPLSLTFSSIRINIHKQLLWSRLCSKEKYYSTLLLYTKIQQAIQKQNCEQSEHSIQAFYYFLLTLQTQ